ncbi:hypothetical protein PR048_020861 [Dryococelus australis]|uniref:DDE-1 domain-containing protein n=1 Tax=Dryococelus australis TaxID=614101 RepID=A0ABQ9GWL0_9NEOP|nr:hypothetical protein PR048_020861 [Dryococelus australis]
MKRKTGFLFTRPKQFWPVEKLDVYITSLHKCTRHYDMLSPCQPVQRIETGMDRKLTHTESGIYDFDMDSLFYGLTRRDVRLMAYQLAIKNNISNPFGASRIAGENWLKRFLRRHKDRLSIQRPTGTYDSRVSGFNRDKVKVFYDNLDELFDKHHFPADRVFNVDETGLSIVQSKILHVVGHRGKCQIGVLTAQERGSLMTVIVCMSATGTFVPPMRIFPRTNMSLLLMRGAPPGSISACHPSGRIQSNLFKQWFDVLLVLDGHHSHTRDIEVIDLALVNNVHLVTLPPHCTHKIQPLDKTLMGPLKMCNIVICGRNDLFQANLVDMIPYARFNEGYKHMLTVINEYSEFPGPGLSIRRIRIAKFYNPKVKALMRKHNINHYSTYRNLTASIIERGKCGDIRCERELQAADNTAETLPRIKLDHSHEAWRLVNRLPASNIRKDSHMPNPTVGDLVRIFKQKGILEKGFMANCSLEHFCVRHILNYAPRNYFLQDLNNFPSMVVSTERKSGQNSFQMSIWLRRCCNDVTEGNMSGGGVSLPASILGSLRWTSSHEIKANVKGPESYSPGTESRILLFGVTNPPLLLWEKWGIFSTGMKPLYVIGKNNRIFATLLASYPFHSVEWTQFIENDGHPPKLPSLSPNLANHLRPSPPIPLTPPPQGCDWLTPPPPASEVCSDWLMGINPSPTPPSSRRGTAHSPLTDIPSQEARGSSVAVEPQCSGDSTRHGDTKALRPPCKGDGESSYSIRPKGLCRRVNSLPSPASNSHLPRRQYDWWRRTVVIAAQILLSANAVTTLPPSPIIVSFAWRSERFRIAMSCGEFTAALWLPSGSNANQTCVSRTPVSFWGGLESCSPTKVGVRLSSANTNAGDRETAFGGSSMDDTPPNMVSLSPVKMLEYGAWALLYT